MLQHRLAIPISVKLRVTNQIAYEYIEGARMVRAAANRRFALDVYFKEPRETEILAKWKDGIAMPRIQEDLSYRIKILEDELRIALEEKEQAFRYRWADGKAKFDKDAVSRHRRLKLGLPTYLLHSRALAVLTAPVIYVGIVPFALLDLFLLIYQGICFPIYGIPKVQRADYIIFDRGHLKYLNLLERLNCIYCSYANGLCSFVTEVTARTEQHWCPIKHARRLRAPHSRYPHFFHYGNAEEFRRQGETVRNDFVDLRNLTPGSPDSPNRNTGPNAE
jgi:hypothetical protein